MYFLTVVFHSDYSKNGVWSLYVNGQEQGAAVGFGHLRSKVAPSRVYTLTPVSAVAKMKALHAFID